MKLFIIVVASVIFCCSAHDEDEPLLAIELLKAILNETRATRELQYLSLERSIAQENALNKLIGNVETTNMQLAALIAEIQSTRLDQNACCNNTDASLKMNIDQLGNISDVVHIARQEAQDYHRLTKQWYAQPNVFVSLASCEDIKTISPSAPSGYYNIAKSDGTTQRVYCDIGHLHHLCGSTGWTRVAYLDMSDTSQQCPTELRLYDEGGVRGCRRQNSFGASCNSVTFSTNGISYSQVCGRVIGYQWGTPEAIHGHSTIDSPYVDGVSITRGSPRQHIWTLAGGKRETGTGSGYCPCNDGSTAGVPAFIGDDYFCESGTPTYPKYQLYPNDPLWDGKACGGDEFTCCNLPGSPWFHKVLNSTSITTPYPDYVELRLCCNQESSNEDTLISLYEIYVK